MHQEQIMAKPTRIFLSGKIENLIFYEFQGKPCVRKAPIKVRQTRATKASAKLFGMAVSMSASLRAGLAKVLPPKTRRKNMYLLNTALLKWLKQKNSKISGPPSSLTPLHGLSFNEDCSIFSYLHMEVGVNWSRKGMVVVRIPALTPAKDLKAPTKTRSVIWRIAAASCTVNNSSVLEDQAQVELEMPYNSDPVDAQSIELPFTSGRGNLSVVVISLQYRVEKKDWTAWVTDSRWLPVDIIGVDS